jgi:hypothetical protein
MDSQNQPITHTTEPTIMPIAVETSNLPQYWVTLPELILASTTLIRAIADLIRVLREESK